MERTTDIYLLGFEKNGTYDGSVFLTDHTRSLSEVNFREIFNRIKKMNYVLSRSIDKMNFFSWDWMKRRNKFPTETENIQPNSRPVCHCNGRKCPIELKKKVIS